ncbi:MmyB family transcriptional regulator [Streptomyces sp. NPDC001393]
MASRGNSLRGRPNGIRRLRHPVIGEITLDWNTFTSATDPDQKLIVWTAPPGSPAREALRLLASWAADQNLRASGNVT